MTTETKKPRKLLRYTGARPQRVGRRTKHECVISVGITVLSAEKWSAIQAEAQRRFGEALTVADVPRSAAPSKATGASPK